MNTKTRSKSINLISKSASETLELGKKFSKIIKKGDVVLLIANLGSGKTTFVQGIAKGWGVKEKAMSPTFILAQTLEPNKKNKSKGPLHHLDFYRLDKKEIWDLGIQDYLRGEGIIHPGVVLIEWADLCEEVWPHEFLRVDISINQKDKSRSFKFSGIGEKYSRSIQMFGKNR